MKRLLILLALITISCTSHKEQNQWTGNTYIYPKYLVQKYENFEPNKQGIALVENAMSRNNSKAREELISYLKKLNVNKEDLFIILHEVDLEASIHH
jgi:hypothetical protein